jgi:hypothetical protein
MHSLFPLNNNRPLRNSCAYREIGGYSKGIFISRRLDEN